MDPVPPPWTLQGDAHLLLAWMPPGAPAGAQLVPAGCTLRPRGVGAFIFIRYAASNVGPYDELLWLPPWGLRFDGVWRHSVTRIFVSSEASLVNGRANWGIPKELARFSVTPLGPCAAAVHVSAGTAPVASFTIAWSRRSVPANLGALPVAARTLVQELGGRRFQLAPSARGCLHATRFSDLDVNATLFPDVTRGRKLAAFSLRDFVMTFPVPCVSVPSLSLPSRPSR
jgi:acetoacetate decarboxylase